MKRLLALGAILFAVGCGAETPVAQTADELSGQFCGGIAGIQCPAGYVCVDNPSDGCDPRKGGADCGGVCKRDHKCHKQDSAYHYVGTSSSECSRIKFFCAEGSYFADGCGCGCYYQDTCPIIDCAAPPEGCHYEGMVTSPCDQQTCGSLVCDGSTL